MNAAPFVPFNQTVVPVDAAAQDNIVPVEFGAPKNAFAEALRAAAVEKSAALATAKKGGVQGLAHKRSDAFSLNPYLLEIMEGFNSRDFNDPANLAHVDEIARSIAEIGFLKDKPITVVWKDSRPKITDGECRWRGAIRAIEVYGAQLVALPIITEEYASEAEMIANQITRNGAKPFSVFERADNYKKLLRLGWDKTDIAKRFNLSTVRIDQVLTLGTVGKDIRTLVNTGKVSADFAFTRLTANGGDESKALADLTDAVKTAEASGKSKASAKHLGEGAVRRPSAASNQRELATLIGGAEQVGEADGKVVLAITTENYARIKALLGL